MDLPQISELFEQVEMIAQTFTCLTIQPCKENKRNNSLDEGAIVTMLKQRVELTWTRADML